MKYIITLLLIGCIACNQTKKMDGEYSISASSESDERAKALLPMDGKEDVSNILTLNTPMPIDETKSEEKKYFANERYDWIVTLESTAGTYFKRELVSKYFDDKWREEHKDPWLYCIPKNDTKWTFFNSGENDSNEFTKLAVAWKLFDQIEESPTVFTEAELTKYQNDVNDIAEKFKDKSQEENFTPKDAAFKSQELAQFVQTNNVYSLIVLKADGKFEGKEIWDVMMSLGLKWGDMDLFHWDNASGNELMSVWTSTDPGYFLPEEIAADNVQTDDLVFGFSVPRSIAAKEVLAAMYKAAMYAQSRLGGKILDENGLQYDVENENKRIEAVLGNLESRSIRPGVGDALYLFQ
jgi:cell division protein ZipA